MRLEPPTEGGKAYRDEITDLIDSVLERHGVSSDELKRDLEAVRAEYVAACLKQKAVEVAATALKVATWIKFFFEFLRE